MSNETKSNVKHTPGPIDWQKKEITPGEWKVAIQGDDYFCVETDRFAICNDVAYSVDAKLIAAAPDLAEALLTLLGEAEAWGVKMDAFRPARAALAKAGL